MSSNNISLNPLHPPIISLIEEIFYWNLEFNLEQVKKIFLGEGCNSIHN